MSTLCREMTNTAVAKAERLYDITVKASTLDRIYLQQLIACAGSTDDVGFPLHL